MLSDLAGQWCGARDSSVYRISLGLYLALSAPFLASKYHPQIDWWHIWIHLVRSHGRKPAALFFGHPGAFAPLSSASSSE